jgi:hypothetical protein
MIGLKIKNTGEVELNISRLIDKHGCPTAIILTRVERETSLRKVVFSGVAKSEKCEPIISIPSDFRNYNNQGEDSSLSPLRLETGKYSADIEFDKSIYQRDFELR